MALTTGARWLVLGALFLIPFLPLYVASDQFFPFITGKGFAFRILVEFAAGAFVILALADRKYRPKFSWTLALYAAFVAWMFVADFFAANPHKAFWSNYERMDGWVTMIHVFLFFVMASTVLTADKLWKRWWQTVLGASALISFYGLWQVLGLAEIHQGGARVDASFGNAIYLAVYLLFTIGIALWQAIESKGFLRYALLALAALQVLLAFFTATRGVIIGIFAAAMLVAFLWAMSVKGKPRKVAATVLGVLIAAGGIFFLARGTDFVRQEPTLARLSTVFDSEELAVRLTLWGQAYQGFTERPLTGWGHEGYNFVFNKYYHPSLYAQEPWFDRAHNTYLDWLIAGGLPAFLLFVVLLGSAAYAIFQKTESRPERLILLGILAGYALQGVSAFDNLFSYILLAAVLAMAHARSSRPLAFLEKPSEVGSGALGAVALPVALVATIAAVWMVNVPGIQASQDLIRAASLARDPAAALRAIKDAGSRGSFASQEIAEQAVNLAAVVVPQGSVAEDIRRDTAGVALAYVEKEVARAPDDARLRLIYGRTFAAIGNRDEAVKQIDAAIALSPKKQATLFQRGVERWQGGDRAGAAEDFAAAYALDTSYGQAAAYAAAGRILLGDMAGGDAILMEAFGTTGADYDILRYVYYDAKRFDRLVESAKLHADALPGDVQARLMLAQAYILAGRMNEAKAELADIVATHPDAAAAAADLLRQAGS